MNLDDIQGVFFTECEESLEAAEAGLETCKAGEQDAETINAIFRAVHSIKGGAGAFGHMPLQGFTHCFETLLADVREDRVGLTEPLVDLMLHALDCLRDHVDAARAGTDAPDDEALIAKLTAAQADNNAASGEASSGEQKEVEVTQDKAPSDDLDLDGLLDDLAAPSSAAEPVAQQPPAPGLLVHVRPHAEAMTNGNDPLLWLRELRQMGGTCQHCDTEEVPSLDAFDPQRGYLGWTFEMPGSVDQADVAEIFDFAGETCGLAYGPDENIPPVAHAGEHTDVGETEVAEAQVAAKAEEEVPTVGNAPQPAKVPAKRNATENQSVRIELSKLDKLIDGVGELVIAQAMLAQKLGANGMDHIEELAMLEGLVRDIQERAMAIRAQPISSVFNRVPRLLRELASSTGKHVKLEVQGEGTELDKTVIERLGEPMTHLIRNAVDHGIEDPADRVEAGKSADGTLRLSAEHRAGRILIRISDDGRGIDREKVLAKAIEKGVVSEGQALSDEEIDNLIFAPGFSTAKEVSSISGRGVGMDVVRQNVKELGGRITIESTPGSGTAFVLTLPLTLAIADGMIVQVGQHSMVIPLANVVESLRPTQDSVRGLGTSRQMLNVRDQFVPIVPLGNFVGEPSTCTKPEDGVLVIVETERFGQVALLVDVIADQRQFVIKSLETHYHPVPGIAGATILGDGRVALIVDVDHIVTSASREPTEDLAA
ncbi:chemotaxis protein CheA [Altererythrobacter lutimaris]|uniref:Chemotaxis protein CheA n=1 Tax=Altererythrobacter lutimaris TaxID=2743979 RepID=A0A850HEK4_9SPHN|nr:chemotaxis protein CheA [Altererythrobacter lutimaris]NVE95318.1 chemotaxis protein CheA [Altererythrobacter lutimaris]